MTYNNNLNNTNDIGPVVAINNLDNPWARKYIGTPFADSLSDVGSFETYIKTHYQEQYIDLLRDTLYRDILPYSGKIKDPEFIFLVDAEITAVKFYQNEDQSVHVDTIIKVSAMRTTDKYIETQEKNYCISGTVYFPYDDSFYFDLFQEVKLFNPTEKEHPLSPYLIPYMKPEDYELKADEILHAYYPEIFTAPNRINAELLAKRLGLSVLYLKLTNDGSVLGRLFFETAMIEYIGPDGYERSVRIPDRTIVVDYEACIKNHEGKVSQTIIHECIHYLTHHNFYCLQHLYNSSVRSLNCGGKMLNTPDQASPIYWMEKQADYIAFSIQMPAKLTEQVFEDFLYKNFHCMPEYADFSMLEKAVIHVSDLFGVSRRCAQIRLQALGYRNLQGLFNFVNGKYIKPYAVNEDMLNPGETLTISHKDAAEEYQKNPFFRSLLDSGNYVYVEGHFCLDKSKYLYKDRTGAKRLTTYARYHLDECCLIFQVHSNATYSYRNGILNKESKENTITFQPENETPGMRAVRINKILYDPKMPHDFSGTLCYHMDRLNITKGKLAEATGWDDKTIQRYRNREERPADIRSVIALCVVLHLEPELSMDLLNKAGYSLRSSVEDILYGYILRFMSKSSLMECNTILTDSGLKPLIRAAAY